MNKFFQRGLKTFQQKPRGLVLILEKQTFAQFKNVVENYHDKFEMIKVIDQNHEFLSDYYRNFEKQSIKILVISVISQYLDVLWETNESKLNYGIILLRFQNQEY